MKWEEAKTHLRSKSTNGRVIYLGTRAALSTASGAGSPSKPSRYQKVFKNGATIYPRSFYFVRVRELQGAPDAEIQYWAETDPEQAAAAKKPYDDVHLSRLVEGRFIFTTAIARHLLPFAHLDPATIVLPIEASNGMLKIVQSEELTRQGYREFSKWMQEAEELWDSKRGGKSEKQTVYEWLDYQGKLTAQLLSQRHLVLYTASGTNVSATYFDSRALGFSWTLNCDENE